MDIETGKMSDLERRFICGDDEAFTQVVERYSRRVYALCYRVLRDEEDAKDMAQEVFVRVHSKRKSFKGRSSLYTWIYRIALNMCFTQIKKRKMQTIPLDEVEGVLSAKSDHDAGSTAALERLIADTLEGLPPKQKAVFIMRFYEKMTYKEIAEAMGTSIGGAKANQHFAVDHLRRLLGEVDTK